MTLWLPKMMRDWPNVRKCSTSPTETEYVIRKQSHDEVSHTVLCTQITVSLPWRCAGNIEEVANDREPLRTWWKRFSSTTTPPAHGAIDIVNKKQRRQCNNRIYICMRG